jgi:hypothetical protein
MPNVNNGTDDPLASDPDILGDTWDQRTKSFIISAVFP